MLIFQHLTGTEPKRIGRFLQRNSQESSLQFGAFAFYESATSGPRKTAREKVNDRIKNIFQNSKRLLGNEYDVTINTSEIYEEFKNNAWSAACILIKLKKK